MTQNNFQTKLLDPLKNDALFKTEFQKAAIIKPIFAIKSSAT